MGHTFCPPRLDPMSSIASFSGPETRSSSCPRLLNAASDCAPCLGSTMRFWSLPRPSTRFDAFSRCGWCTGSRPGPNSFPRLFDLVLRFVTYSGRLNIVLGRVMSSALDSFSCYSKRKISSPWWTCKRSIETFFYWHFSHISKNHRVVDGKVCPDM